MNAFQDWFARVFNPKRNAARDVQELSRTRDDVETNAPARQKQAKRKAPERK